VLFIIFGIVIAMPASSLSQSVSESRFNELVAQAQKASADNRLDESVVYYTKALTLRPLWAEGWWSLGTLEYDQDHYAKASNAFTKLLALNPRNGTAHAMLGLCQFEMHLDNAALAHLLAAEKYGVVKDDQLRNVAIFHLGLLQLRSRSFSSAKETFAQLAKDGVRTNELISSLGQVALMIRPENAPAEGTEGFRVVNRVGDAEVALAAKDFARARQIYAGLSADFPQYPNLHLAYGRLLLELHESDDAVAQFVEELRNDPDNIHSLLEIAAVRYQVDSENALPFAERAVRLAPKVPLAHFLLGAIRLDIGDTAAAIPQLELARRGLPNTAQVYFVLGTAYARAGRKLDAERARAEFARLNALDSDRSDATVYGEQSAGLRSKDIQSIDAGGPPR